MSTRSRLNKSPDSRLMSMKRAAVITKLKAEGKRCGLEFEKSALTRHDAYQEGNTTRALGRYCEIDDATAKKFFDQCAQERGRGGWR